MLNDELSEFHWMMDMLQNIDIGLVVLNPDNQVMLWNSFMENHSGVLANSAKNKLLFDLFPDIPKDWFKQKVDAVFKLRTRAFTVWEQRPYLFKFNNYRPITGSSDFMYQNISIIPLNSLTGEVNNICIIIYDVTDIATNSQALEAVNRKLRHLSRTDRLTGLNNRGYWQERQEQEFSRFQRYQTPCTLIIFDIDHFKQINDTYGHQAGDQVIKICAQTLLGCARDIDICGRYGGEEFVVLLDSTGKQGGEKFAERIRGLIENLSVEHHNDLIRFTISLGVCEISTAIATPQQWIELADGALYESKEGGRNCTTVHQPEKAG